MEQNGKPVTVNNGAAADGAQLLAKLVARLEQLPYIEAIYGYVEEGGCAVVAIADDPTSAQRDAVWEIEWGLIAEHPQTAVDIRLIPRRGRSLGETYQDGGEAAIARMRTPA